MLSPTIDSIRLTHDFSDIFQPILMWLFAWSVLAISGAMLVIRMQIVESNFIGRIEDIAQRVSLIFFYFIINFSRMMEMLYHYFWCSRVGWLLGQNLADAFDEIQFTIKQLDWLLLPIELKRMLPMIIAVAHRPVTVECFGSITCTRDVFKNVSTAQYEYFY